MVFLSSTPFKACVVVKEAVARVDHRGRLRDPGLDKLRIGLGPTLTASSVASNAAKKERVATRNAVDVMAYSHRTRGPILRRRRASARLLFFGRLVDGSPPDRTALRLRSRHADPVRLLH